MKQYYFVFDTETTGVNPRYDDVIELAGIKFAMENGIVLYDTMQFIDQYFALDREVPANARAVNGLSRNLLMKYSNGNYLEDCIDSLSKYFYDKDCIIVNYNTVFDTRIMNNNLRRAGAEIMQYKSSIDVMQYCINPYTHRPMKLILAKNRFLTGDINGLYEALFKKNPTDHSALYDAYVTFRLFLALGLFKK